MGDHRKSSEAELTAEQIEHIAVRAAELGDPIVEGACDRALSHPEAQLGTMTFERVVRDIARNEIVYAEWLEDAEVTRCYRKRTP